MRKLTVEEKRTLGKQWVEILMLRESPEFKNRYLTTGGDMTTLGVFETITRLVDQKFDATECRGANAGRWLL